METDHTILLIDTCKNFPIFYLKKKEKEGNHQSLDLTRNIQSYSDITKGPKQCINLAVSPRHTPQTYDLSVSDSGI